jgi:hypothetical protein
LELLVEGIALLSALAGQIGLQLRRPLLGLLEVETQLLQFILSRQPQLAFLLEFLTGPIINNPCVCSGNLLSGSLNKVGEPVAETLDHRWWEQVLVCSDQG